MARMGWGMGIAAAGALALASTASAQSSDASTRSNDDTASTARQAACANPCDACMQRIRGDQASQGDDACPNACALCDRQRQQSANAQPGSGSDQPATGQD